MDTKVMDPDTTKEASQSSTLHKWRLPIVVGFHLFSVLLAYAGAFYIRFDLTLPPEYREMMLATLPMILAARAASYYFYKTHAASWRFAYLRDLVDIIKAVVLGSAIFLALLVFLDRLHGFPRSVIIIEAMLSASVMAGTKLMFRYFSEYASERGHKIKKNVVIVGAGKAGVLMLNEIRTNRSLGINCVGFVDDDNYLKGTNIQGVPVLGRSENLPELVKKYDIDEIIVAIPASGHKNVVRVSEVARKTGAKVSVLPSLGKMIQDGEVSAKIKHVSPDELLGRRVIKFCRESDKRLMEGEITGKAVLVTGAGGSIGSELARQVAEFRPGVLILFERYETSLYEIELELRKNHPELKAIPVIGDILDTEKLEQVMDEYGIELVYHAAAYKHVPMMEREPLEAVRNNVLGTWNVARTARAKGVKKFVLISTDKAVNPANVMGTTKRIAELVVQSLNAEGGDTRFIAVRFGNVIGSNGSVIPIFRRQIAEGGPVTVTHPEMTRYFMSIAEAVQLVMTAGAMGEGGEIFLLDMGEPVRISDVAEAMVRLSGLEVGSDIEVIYSGVRPGEKLHEELYWQGEGIVPTENKKITKLRADSAAGNGVLESLERLREATARGDVERTKRMLGEMVPESMGEQVRQ